jgi:hypothetical protein
MVIEQHAAPAVEVARCRDLVLLGVKGWAFGQPPMGGDAVAIYAEASARGLDDEAVVFEFAEPALHRSGGFGAKVFGGIAGGSINLSVVQVVHPQIASQNDVQGPCPVR